MTNVEGTPSANLLGVNFGGKKIEAASLDRTGVFIARRSAPTPPSYDEAISIIRGLVDEVGKTAGTVQKVGISMPGSMSPRTDMIRNACVTYLNGRLFGRDLGHALGKTVLVSNDANCLALSEATDGAAVGAKVVFAVILDSGCGGGLAINGKVIDGANGIAGEWGHSPLPWRTAAEQSPRPCWCGLSHCIEAWLSTTLMQRSYREQTPASVDDDVIRRMRAGEPIAVDLINSWLDRLARALATVANVIDPDVFVFGGAMSQLSDIYSKVPSKMKDHVFSDHWFSRLRPAKWGDSSGLRGAAWLGE